ncbi:hypothetical protein [Klebsiella grimontii]|uniref:hypothetical protein n=1 Tax=Klebsiella grimontii TaxID=2058152 RepID=UPI00293134A0|nr:hypothetical protein [Klebsiella grimontii]
MTHSKIFSKAWKLARRGAKKYGGNVKSYFAESLRTIHAANAIDATINQSRFEALAGQPELTREDAIELASYQAAEAKASFMRTLQAEQEERHKEMVALVAELSIASRNAIICKGSVPAEGEMTP